MAPSSIAVSKSPLMPILSSSKEPPTCELELVFSGRGEDYDTNFEPVDRLISQGIFK